jgi:hypothetical protein
LDRPENIPDFLWEIMLNTWVSQPKQRPSFKEISTALLESTEKLQIQETQIAEEDTKINISSTTFAYSATNYDIN